MLIYNSHRASPWMKHITEFITFYTNSSVFIKEFICFSKVALQRSNGIDETGEIVWYLALCLLLAWIIVGAALIKGIKSSGKVISKTH